MGEGARESLARVGEDGVRVEQKVVFSAPGVLARHVRRGRAASGVTQRGPWRGQERSVPLGGSGRRDWRRSQGKVQHTSDLNESA